MQSRVFKTLFAFAVCSVAALGQGSDGLRPFNKPEEFTIRSRKPEELQNLPSPLPTAPPTVSVPHPNATEFKLTLDEAIRTALENSEVIRVLAANTATSTGQTIYGPAIAHTDIDSALASFDPVLSANNSYRRDSSDMPLILGGIEGILGTRSNQNDFSVGVSQSNLAGGEASLDFTDTWTRSGPRRTLNPQNIPTLEASYTQPLLAGRGVAANRVPILLARIQTEQSYFRFKDSYQRMVESVIRGYWNLVFARTDLWAREQQVELAKFLYEQADAQKEAGLGDIGSVAQRKVALANFRVSLIAARAALLDAEAAMKNVLGFPPNDGIRLVPITPPTREEIEFNWPELVELSTTYRPDVIEAKLILDADRQRLIQAKNNAQPTLNAVARYRWNGISGEFPSGTSFRSRLNQSGGYTLGINFSLPVRLRASRANLRSTELALAQDRANLKQTQHAATHDVATTLRGLASTYAQYEAQTEVRQAAFENLEQLAAQELSGLANFQVVLQGISDWGNAVSSEARSLTGYNSQLASLELETGTILETHGIRFYEERYGSLGPWGKHGPCYEYPQDLRPQENSMRYEIGEEPAEKFFNLDQAPRRESQQRSGDMEDDWESLDDPIDDSSDPMDDFDPLDEPNNGFEVDRTPASKAGPSLGPAARASAPPIPIRPKWKRVAGR
ncbi:MAG: TolC family protein [Planctomycetaceae bacterium]